MNAYVSAAAKPRLLFMRVDKEEALFIGRPWIAIEADFG